MSYPSKIGKYEVIDLIGTGGFGQVLRASDPLLHRKVAIKLCSLEDRQLLKRFAREAEIAGSLQHPNIVVIHDFGFDDGKPYLVQELLPGCDLDEVINEREWIPYPLRFDYLLQIADALAYAHSMGIIHRDIKPDNIRLLENGCVKVMDFGIARFAHAAHKLTTAGVSLGTIGYLAPEQIRGEEVDGRADLFSYGVLAYELLSYQRPFEAESSYTILHRILNTDPHPLSYVWGGCPAPVDALVMRCLARDRDERHAGFDELLPQLRAAVGEALESPPLRGSAGGVAAIATRAGGTSVSLRDLDLSETIELGSHAGRPPRHVEAAPGGVARILAGGRRAADRAVRRVADLGRRYGLRWGGLRRVQPRPPLPTGSRRTTSHSYDTALGRLGRPSLVLSAVAGVVALVSIGVWLGTRPALEEEVVVPAVPVLSDIDVVPPAPPGEVWVTARPWGRIEGASRGASESVPGLEASTPAWLDLPTGAHRIYLSRPDVEGPFLCRVEVTLTAAASCEVDFFDLDSTDYFKEVGWYR